MAEAHVPKTQPFAFSADEGTDVGYGRRNRGIERLQAGRQQVHRQDLKVTINTKLSGLSAVDQKAVEDAEDEAAAIVD